MSTHIKQQLCPQPFDMDLYVYRRMVPNDFYPLPATYAGHHDNFADNQYFSKSEAGVNPAGVKDSSQLELGPSRASLESVTTQALSVKQQL